MKPKKPRNPAAQPRGILRIDPDAFDRDPIHGATLLVLSKPVRAAGADIRLRSTASGWTVVLRSDPWHGNVLAESVSYNDAQRLVSDFGDDEREVLAKREAAR